MIICTYYFPVPLSRQSFESANVHVHACVCVCVVCVSSLYSSASDIVNCWNFSNPYECLSQHNQALTPTLGNPFINIPPLNLLGLWYSALGHPHVKTLSLFYSASKCPRRAAPLSCMEAFLPLFDLWLATQSASSLWISSILDLDFCSEYQASILFNILQTNWASLCKLLFSMNAS